MWSQQKDADQEVFSQGKDQKLQEVSNIWNKKKNDKRIFEAMNTWNSCNSHSGKDYEKNGWKNQQTRMDRKSNRKSAMIEKSYHLTNWNCLIGF